MTPPTAATDIPRNSPAFNLSEALLLARGFRLAAVGILTTVEELLGVVPVHPRQLHTAQQATPATRLGLGYPVEYHSHEEEGQATGRAVGHALLRHSSV